ncbi:phytanoyl-CoA dioxygenase family protein [Hahella sp. HN01]|uniref:phytanoyl-CoA dioxygenase family protein n=1 Tax=Hahella sp. HN01 TaxID=2847262 RepID=UPI001C1EDCB9|nr:phytanoyl-CoA dioxygenase family protein [Hahella sp. HN01]MBU6955153.1 phytanoyl-CoA dioxygenase family protein [Hahella sp. HN01]
MTFDFHHDGFEWLRDALPASLINAILQEVARDDEVNSGSGVRNAERKYATLKEWLAGGDLKRLACRYLEGAPQQVRTILFNKSPRKNWLVTWHQDRTVCVKARFDAPDWGPWSEKDGVMHVQPPIATLERMLAFRIHLDPTDESNGCLKVIPGSHREGLLSHERIQQVAASSKPLSCAARAGDILVMKPHLLHASSKGTAPNQRRILHVEFSDYPLPAGAQWVS